MKKAIKTQQLSSFLLIAGLFFLAFSIIFGEIYSLSIGTGFLISGLIVWTWLKRAGSKKRRARK